MAKKPEFDLVVLTFGWRKLAVPKEAAMAIFDLFAGHDVYELTDKWESGASVKLAKLLAEDAMPTIGTLGPVQFHQMLENQRMEDEKEEVKRKARDGSGS